jgi:hypothetical protein
VTRVGPTRLPSARIRCPTVRVQPSLVDIAQFCVVLQERRRVRFRPHRRGSDNLSFVLDSQRDPRGTALICPGIDAILTQSSLTLSKLVFSTVVGALA